MGARASARERAAARVEARLTGSAALHALVMVRDLLVYGPWWTFTPETVFPKTRRRLSGAHESMASPSDDDVCLAIVDHATRTSKAFDNMAKNFDVLQWGYTIETMTIYGLAMCTSTLTLYVVELARHLRWVQQDKQRAE